MNCRKKDYNNDYRVNILNNGTVISVEITCCSRHVGELRFKNGESKKCPYCGTLHSLIIQHNHFHIRSDKPAFNKVDKDCSCDRDALEEKAL
jgi:hypothetical protein